MKRPSLIAIAAAGCLALGIGGFALAQQTTPSPTPPPGGPGRPGPMGPGGPGRMGPPPGMMMGMRGGGPFGILEFDTNGDGRLAKPEFDAAQRARFTAMDANNDGGVVPDEMRAYAEKQHQEGEAARFQILDADHNGQLSQAEFNAAREHGPGPGMGRGPGMRMRGGPGGPDGPGPGMRGRRGPGGPGGQFGPGAPPGAPQANAPRRAGPLDADSDGKITLTEFTARSAEVFDRADLNNDNVVTIAELQTLAKAQR